MAFESVGGVTEYVKLHETLFYPFGLWDFGRMDALIRGSGADNPRPVHTSFAAEVTVF